MAAVKLFFTGKRECFKKEKNLQYLLDVTSIGGLSVFLPLFCHIARNSYQGRKK